MGKKNKEEVQIVRKRSGDKKMKPGKSQCANKLEQRKVQTGREKKQKHKLDLVQEIHTNVVKKRDREFNHVESSDDSESEEYIKQFNIMNKTVQRKSKIVPRHDVDSPESTSSEQCSKGNSDDDSEDLDHDTRNLAYMDAVSSNKRKSPNKSPLNKLQTSKMTTLVSNSESSCDSEEDTRDIKMVQPSKSAGKYGRHKSSSKESTQESSGEESDGSEESVEDQEETVDDKVASLRKDLEDMPFEEVQKLQEKVGMKVYNQLFGSVPHHGQREGKGLFKRANKNRPREMSSKRRVPVFREVIPVNKKTVRDPRFDDLSGRFDETIFKNSYSFLSDVKQAEKLKLLKKLKKEKDVDKRKQLQYLIERMTNQERAEKMKEARKQRERQIKRQEQEMVTTGKTPFYLKKSEHRKLELAEKYRELQKSGKIDKYLGKKRKKNASKDRRRLPFQLNK